MSKVMGIYVNVTKTTHQILSCHLTLASNLENFYFFPNFVLNFGKSYQIWGKLAQEQKTLQAENKLGGGKHPKVLIGLTLSHLGGWADSATLGDFS